MTTATAQFFEELAGREQLELLDIPGRWRRMDAFARGRVRSPLAGGR